MYNTKKRVKEYFKNYYRKDLEKLYGFFVPSRNEKPLRLTEIYQKVNGKYKYVIVDNLIGEIKDVQAYFTQIKRYMTPESRLLISYYNHLWEPILELATFIGLRQKTGLQNWLDTDDISNLLRISGYDVITTQRRLLFPADIPFINKYLAHFPVINNFCLTTYTVARPKAETNKEYKVSIIVPATNEEKNIIQILKVIPKFGLFQEFIFVEGNSKDNTWGEIIKLKNRKYAKNIFVHAYKQRGTGKADAVRLGFSKAKGDVLMIYDADLTVSGKDLTKFYNLLSSGQGEFINGSRLVYPMEKEAMQSLNKAGNKIFSLIFTWILGQHFKDTLCGSKAFFKRDYEYFRKFRKLTGDIDPFGDFDLIFGAVKKNLKIIEVPVRYKERIYGSTNINRFRHGLLLIRMTFKAFRIFKAW